MSDHSLIHHLGEAVKDYAGYVMAAMGVGWAMMVWAFRSAIGRYQFATEDYVKQELAKCHDELHRKIRELETEMKSSRDLNTAEHQNIGRLIADNSTKMRDLVIEHLSKK